MGAVWGGFCWFFDGPGEIWAGRKARRRGLHRPLVARTVVYTYSEAAPRFAGGGTCSSALRSPFRAVHTGGAWFFVVSGAVGLVARRMRGECAREDMSCLECYSQHACFMHVELNSDRSRSPSVPTIFLR